MVILFGISGALNAQTQLFTSGSHVGIWDPVMPAVVYPNEATSTCSIVPSVGLNAAWTNPHVAYDFGSGAHPWQPGAGWSAQWINAWSDLNSQGPGGQSWTKYSTEITGTGEFVLNLLADS